MIIGSRKTVASSNAANTSLNKSTLVKREAGLSPLLMYNDPPNGKMDFDEFTTLALDRFAGKSGRTT